MALFRISKGLKANLPETKTAGHCWYTIDDSMFYVDYADENGEVKRQALNAKNAETLSGASLNSILSDNELEIPTSKAVFDALSGIDERVSVLEGEIFNLDAVKTLSELEFIDPVTDSDGSVFVDEDGNLLSL